ncbi:hybrid sensor histidine kinase/response regulator [Desulfobacter curvatus]|uniref:hybrid sensor histidine kinase/response regulator n=1 Tax=Desulfobacter curvatus TaxID=2290 RepID=UPI0012FA4565|nr:PAS domain S-box protein [Desulfobacter curvatus]
MKKLLELSQMTEESINALAEFALEEACRLTQSEFGCLSFLNKDQAQLTMHLWPKESVNETDCGDGLPCKIRETGLWAEVEKSGSVLVINDYENYAPLSKHKVCRDNVKINRVMSAPAFENDKIVALINVGNKKENYNDSDIRQLHLMMDGMWKILQGKKAEIELKKSEERYRLLADNAADTIWILQFPDLIFSYVSPSMESLLGYTPAQFLGLEMKDYVTEDSLKQIPAIIAEELDEEFDGDVDLNRLTVFELELIKKGGTTIWVEISAGFLRNEQGESDAILGIFRDISDRKRADEALQLTTELMREAGRIAKVGAWSVDIKSQAIIWSDEMNAIHERHSSSPPTFGDVERFIAPEWQEKILNACHRCVGEGQSLDEEFEIITAKGRRRWVHVTGEAVRDDTGKITRAVGALQDISDRIRADEERERLQQHLDQARKMEAIGVLAGGIAHDFNNILSGVMGFTDLAMHEAKGNQTLETYLSRVSSSSLRARDLVKQILTFSRNAEVEKQPTDIKPIIKELLKFIRASLPAGIDIQHDLRLEQGWVFGDATQIYQVLMGLFTNAGYAMKDHGGVLEVILDRVKLDDTQTGFLGKISAGEFIELVISDTGCGIHKKYLNRIFEPFFTTKGRGEGTGMGLATVYGIIKEMSGTISVYSEIEVGTTFRILLPEHDRAESAETDVNTGLKKGQGNILVVDDEKEIAESACDILAILGYSAVMETDSTKAIENVKNNPAHYDLVLTDMTMPHLDGFELAKQIKEINPEIAVVLATGFSQGLTEEKCRNAGIANMVMKPMTSGELSLTIAKAMNEKE